MCLEPETYSELGNLLKHFWTEPDLQSMRYDNPATSRVPKKAPMTQPISTEKLLPLSRKKEHSRKKDITF